VLLLSIIVKHPLLPYMDRNEVLTLFFVCKLSFLFVIINYLVYIIHLLVLQLTQRVILNPGLYRHCLLLDVDLEMFLRFNKVRALVDNTKLLAKALSKSEILEVIVYCSITCKLTENRKIS